jgi:hypothetical protein
MKVSPSISSSMLLPVPIYSPTHTHTHTHIYIYIYIINYNLLFPLVISSKKVKKSFNLFLIQPNYIAEPTLIT